VTAGNSTVDEPLLTVSRPPRFWGSPFGWAFAVAVSVLAVSGLLIVSAEVRQPAEPVVTVKGIAASKQDFFNDEEIQELLRAHNLEVEITARGSREVALDVINQETEQYDFAFPSGQPAADLIKNSRRENGKYQRKTELFSSPMVLASYRPYAEALQAEGVADAQDPDSANPLFYTLNTAKFVGLGEDGKTWNDIGISDIKNGNRILAHTSGVCRSNSGAVYLGLVAFVKNKNSPPQTDVEVDRLAQEIQPIISATGMPESDMFETYVTPEGMSQGPIVVVYEHQFLKYQLDYRNRTGKTDTDRVLLYPAEELQTDPEYIALKPGPADKLAKLLDTDRALRHRMMELGYRVYDATDTVGSKQLFRYLDKQGLPTPKRDEATRVLLPTLDLLETLIRKVGRCPQ
jgi:hypothetical protein